MYSNLRVSTCSNTFNEWRSWSFFYLLLLFIHFKSTTCRIQNVWFGYKKVEENACHMLRVKQMYPNALRFVANLHHTHEHEWHKNVIRIFPLHRSRQFMFYWCNILTCSEGFVTVHMILFQSLRLHVNVHSAVVIMLKIAVNSSTI